MVKSVAFVAALSAVVGCKKSSNEKPAAPPAGSADTGSAAGSGSGSAAGSGSADTGSAAGSGSAAAATTPWDGKSRLEIPGFSTPESVFHEPNTDVYFVSNINGKPLDADDNGFISKVSPDGKIVELKWIDGAKDNVKLNAPKGMAQTGSKDRLLWVADIDTVRKFDAKTGEPKGEVKIDGATFLNDVMMDGGDGVFVTDTGLDASFKSTGTDAVYHIDGAGKITTVIKDKALHGPNGITLGPDGNLWIVTFGANEVIALDRKGKIVRTEKAPAGQLDGIVTDELGHDLIVSSWEGKAVYQGEVPKKGPIQWKTIVENQESPADIAWDHRPSDNMHRVVIPAFQANSVVIVPMP